MWSEYMTPAKKKTAAKPARNRIAASAKKSPVKASRSTSDLGDWRSQVLARMRGLILEADPAIAEERKWIKASNPAGVPVFSRDGIVCTGETYKQAVKLTFANGASLPDPKKLFNAGLDGNARRAIDIHEGDTVDATAFKALVRAAVARNVAAKRK